MFSIHRKLFLALKKVQMVMSTPPQVPNFLIPPTPYCYLEKPVTCYPRGSGKSFSLIFPWFFPDFYCFPWFNIGPEQIPHTMPISDNLNTYHYASLFEQTLAYLSKELCFNFIMKKENQHVIILQNKSTQFWKGLIMWKHFNFSYLALLKPIEK